MTEVDGMVWWRVLLDRDGSVRSCEQVEAVEKDGQSAVFVQANNAAQAVMRAKSWLERRRASRRRSEAKRKERNRDGICRDCKEPVCATSRRYCQEHLEHHRELGRRWYHGESTPRQERSPLEMQQHVNEQARGYRRQQVQLNDVLEKYDTLSPRAFRAWLVSEIVLRGGTVHLASEAA
jgi:hypothetical protein